MEGRIAGRHHLGISGRLRRNLHAAKDYGEIEGVAGQGARSQIAGPMQRVRSEGTTSRDYITRLSPVPPPDPEHCNGLDWAAGVSAL